MWWARGVKGSYHLVASYYGQAGDAKQTVLTLCGRRGQAELVTIVPTEGVKCQHCEQEHRKIRDEITKRIG